MLSRVVVEAIASVTPALAASLSKRLIPARNGTPPIRTSRE